MSSVKGVVNHKAKTSINNRPTNTALQNADTNDTVPKQTHKQKKLQVNLICSLHPLCHCLQIVIINLTSI